MFLSIVLHTLRLHVIKCYINKIAIIWGWLNYVKENLQVSISAEDSFPVVPKWILINLPCKNIKSVKTLKENIIQMSSIGFLPTKTHQTIKLHIFHYSVFADLKTYKSWGVIVPHSLGIPKGFQQGIRWNDLIFQRPLKNKTSTMFGIWY